MSGSMIGLDVAAPSLHFPAAISVRVALGLFFLNCQQAKPPPLLSSLPPSLNHPPSSSSTPNPLLFRSPNPSPSCFVSEYLLDPRALKGPVPTLIDNHISISLALEQLSFLPRTVPSRLRSPNLLSFIPILIHPSSCHCHNTSS